MTILCCVVLFVIGGKSSKLYFVSRADPVLPFQIEDASRSEAEYDRASQVHYTNCSSLVAASNYYIPDQ